MKLMIEIDERIIEYIKEKNLPFEMVDDLCRAVENGTRLIDGDLISRSALREAVNTFYDNHFIGLVPNELIKYAQAVDNFIDNAPTITIEKGRAMMNCNKTDCIHYKVCEEWKLLGNDNYINDSYGNCEYYAMTITPEKALMDKLRGDENE